MFSETPTKRHPLQYATAPHAHHNPNQKLWETAESGCVLGQVLVVSTQRCVQINYTRTNRDRVPTQLKRNAVSREEEKR